MRMLFPINIAVSRAIESAIRPHFAGQSALGKFSVLIPMAILTLLSLTGCGGPRDTSSGGSAKGASYSDRQNASAELQPVNRFRDAVAAKDWAVARQHATAAMLARPDDPDLVTQVATVAAFNNQPNEAADLLVDAARMANFQPDTRVEYAVRALVDVGEIYDAVDLLEQTLVVHPESHVFRKMVVTFLNEIQRTDRIPEHFQPLIRARQFDATLLITLTDTSSRRLSDQTSRRLLERNPDDHRVELMDAFLAMYRRDALEATEILQRILEHHPSFAPAHAKLGQALFATQQWDELANWSQSIPPGSDAFADHWLTIGDLNDQQGKTDAAARAYWEATRRDPNALVAWDRLRSALQRSSVAIPDASIATVEQHASELLRLQDVFNDYVASKRSSQTAALRVADSLVNLGRVWEAEAWSAIAMSLPDDLNPEADAIRESILARLSRDQAWFAKATPAIALDLSFLPKPNEMDFGTTHSRSRFARLIPPRLGTDHLRMADEVDRWGLTGIGGENDPNNERAGDLIRSTGAGGGAIDFDLDGFVDLLVMNAGGTKLAQDSQPNELMRNMGANFVSVYQSAGVEDRGYGQGVCVGDLNEDGWPDLYFTNLGQNRLFLNNGDGTFQDQTDRLPNPNRDTWSTSACMADLDGDGCSDLVVTNYCRVADLLDEGCPLCHPLRFSADEDTFYLSQGNGSFSLVNETWVNPTPGRGLGIVAGALDGKHLGLFVANDMSRNAFYTRQNLNATVGDETSNDGNNGMTDQALSRGVAVDARSQTQASMGVAASDLDLDGDLDFYVTGFAREYNIFYEQVTPGIWNDSSGRLGLIEPTLMTVGFGTQPIDLDNDGLEELIVTNGHIGDFPDPEAPPFEQPMQLFRRDQDGRFGLVDVDGWGDYFRSAHVGRALWKMDVNRDGRSDVMITHGNEPAALLVNRSNDSTGAGSSLKGANNRIGFSLVGTRCNRDGVGSIIRFRCGDQPRTLFMLSGDGYFCSNEKILLAGLGDQHQVHDVEVTWPDGAVQSFGTLDANRHHRIVQNTNEPFVMHHFDGPK